MAVSIRRRSRAAIVSLAIVGGLVLIPAGSASAHVHGITPLRCVGGEEDGANQTDNTPASAADCGPGSSQLCQTGLHVVFPALQDPVAFGRQAPGPAGRRGGCGRGARP